MEQALYQAAILTFEEFAFMFPVEKHTKNEVETNENIKVSVKFNGPFSGQMVLQVDQAILPLIAANMLGDEDPFEDEILYDILGELANVICGNALPQIAGKQEIFQLEAPQMILTPSSSVKPAAVACLDVEASRADVMLYIN